MDISDSFDDDLKRLDSVYGDDEIDMTLSESVGANTSGLTENQSFLHDVSESNIISELEESVEDIQESMNIDLMYGEKSEACFSIFVRKNVIR